MVLNFPLQKHYHKIETQNQIAINVFGYEKGEKFPLYISEERYPETLDLLLISRGAVQHYVLIQDFNSFMYDYSKHKERKHFCRCYNAFQVSAY